MIAGLLLAATLAQRLASLAPAESRLMPIVYDRYRDGRPRRVVATVHGEDDVNVLLLVRLPDASGGKPVVLDRHDVDEIVTAPELVRVIDAKDVVVPFAEHHGIRQALYRVRGDRLVEIADAFSWADDLDGDGVPEIIATAFAGGNECGVQLFIQIGHWNGHRFTWGDERYADIVFPGGAIEDELLLSSAKRYIVRVYHGAKATIDGDPVKPGEMLTLEDGCHTFAMSGRGWAFLQEVDAPRVPR